MTRSRPDVACLIALCFAVLTAAPVYAQGGAAGGPEPEVDEDGFPVPSLEGFRELSESRRTQDTNAYILGDETVFEVHEGPDGTRVASARTGDVLWGYAIFPQGDPARGYFLRDPDCDGRMTQKMALDAPFSPPDCAEASLPRIVMAPYAPDDPAAAIKDVSLSGYPGDPPAHTDGRWILDPARVGTEFSAGTRAVLLWFRWEGDRAGTIPLTVHWYLNCESGLKQDAPLEFETGSRIVKLGGSGSLPSGAYRVEILEDGNRVVTIPFTIGSPTIPPGLDPGSPDCVAEAG